MKILLTERLELRWFDPQDAAFVLELVNDPGWIRFIGDRGLRTEEDARGWIEAQLIPSYWRQGFGLWRVARREGGEALGMCGLVRRDSLPEVDVGYALLPRHRGQGYAREAARACLEYARDALGLTRLLAITSPDNEGSRRVLEAIGMREEARRVLAGEARETAVYGWTRAPGPAGAVGDAAEIEALAGRFLGLFDNRGGAVPLLPILPSLCLPGATFYSASAAAPQLTDLRGFMEPRAALFSEGRLVDFHERELEGETRLAGSIAQRWSRYAKAGLLDGAPCGGEGRKGLQLARAGGRWRIASVVWEDEVGGPPQLRPPLPPR